jgi:hypothetical protein
VAHAADFAGWHRRSAVRNSLRDDRSGPLIPEQAGSVRGAALLAEPGAQTGPDPCAAEAGPAAAGSGQNSCGRVGQQFSNGGRRRLCAL